MGSELHRFGFNGDGDDARWKAAVEKMLTAILTNPHLNIGDSNSEVKFPPESPSIEKNISGATVYHRINEFYIDNEGAVYSLGEYYSSMLFQNGILIWTWATTGYPDPEPDVPSGAVWILSSHLQFAS